MREGKQLLVVVALLLSFVNLAAGQKKTDAGFEKLKSLVGEWQSDEKVNVTYKLISGGTAVMETLAPPNEPEMISIYHLDGDKLAMAHYCSAGNQPRLSAAIPAGEFKSLKFSLVDVANLAKPTEGHINGLTLAFQDRDHITQTWTFRAGGETMSTTHKLTRKP